MPRKSSRKGPKGETETAAHYVGVLLEEIRDQVQLVAESLDMTRGRLETKIDSVRTELKEEIAGTRTALGFKIEQVRKELSEEILETKRDLSGKIDQIGVRLDQHEGEIKELKRVQNLV